MNKKYHLITMLLFAIIAALLLLLIIGFYTQKEPLTKNERILFGSIFIIISLCGIYSAFRPGRLRRICMQSSKHKKPSKKKPTIKLAGHHPICEPFGNHTINYKKYIFCTGCYGLVIGSVISILIMILYVLFNISISNEYNIFILGLGFLLIFINYIETIWYHNTTAPHLLSNSLLILGFLFIVLAIAELTGEASYGIIAIIFSILWLDVRIHLSQYKHRRICQICPKDCTYFT